jgi:metallophosphoesterase superfamily enzyme
VTREGEETKVTETAPISEVMKQSGVVVIEGNTDEGIAVAEAEQTIEEENIEVDEEDYSIFISTKPSHLDFEKSTMPKADMPMMMKLGYFWEAERKLV